MATFTGTSGADVASATTGTLTGFTGGTVAQLQDGSGDTFVGAAGADVIVAGGGADTITGGAGADSLTGGLGADVFVLAAASDLAAGETINGTAEAGTIDTLRLNAAGIYDLSTFTTITNIDQVAFNQNAAGFVLTLADSQVATANANGDAVQGDLSITASLAMTNGVTVNAAGLTGSNRIVVVGTNLGGADSITGGAGDDTIDAGAGADVIVAGGGVDTITGGAGADTLTGGLGADVFVVAATADLAAGEVVDGTAEAATIDTLRLNAGGTYNLSTFTTIANIDQIAFNANSTFNLTLADSQVATADANGDAVQGDLQVTASLAMTSAVTVNAAALTGGNRIVVVGTNLGGGDTITGGAGDDTINSGAGNDTISAGAGADTIDGGTGTDTITGGAGADSLTGGLGADIFVLTAVADLAAGEVIDGTAEAATVDTLRLGAAGAYDLSAFTTIANIDQVAFNQNATGFVLTLADSQAATADANADGVQGDLQIAASVSMSQAVTINAAALAGGNRIVVVGTNLGGADSITGGAGDDTINSGAGSDIVSAGAGADTIGAGSGNDVVTGGSGDDIVDGGGNTDRAVYSGAWTDFTISLAGSTYTISDDRGPGFDGSDSVTNVETFQFSNGTFAASQILNDAPTDIALLGNTVVENASNGTVVGTLGATDADSTLGDTATFTLVDDAGGRFAISGSNLVVADGSLIDREAASSHTVIVRVTDAHGLAYEETFTIAIGDVDESDVTVPIDVDLAADAVDENAAVGTAVGVTALASDADATTNGVTYTLTGNPGGLFQIDSTTGEVTLAAAIDREATGASIDIEVTATSADASTAAATFTIAIGDVDESDVTVPVDVDLATNAVDENATAGTAVSLTVLAADADATTNGVTYALTGNPGGLFQIDPTTGEVTLAAPVDREVVGSSADIEVTATSADGSTAVEVFTIAIGDVDESDVTVPVDVDLAANAVDEDAAVGAAVGVTALASDADATTNSVTYALTGNPGGLFQINPTTGEVTVAAAIDRELIGGSADIEVTATSADGSTSAEVFTIAITDVDESDVTVPVDVDLATNAVDENATAGTAVGLTVLASDADATTNGVTFTLTGNPGGLFEINPTTGEVTVAAAIDRELIGGSADIEVTATSADGSTAVEVFTIAIGDVDESDVTVPVDVDLATNAVDENAAVGTAVGVTALASDADATANGVTYALSGNPGGLFQINPTTGEVTVAAPVDREATGASIDIEVTATSADGSSAVQAFTVQVNDENDSAPVFTSPTSATVNENVATTTAIYTAETNDPDLIGALAYSITGPDSERFVIDSVSGALYFAASPDFETPADADGDNGYEVTIRASDGLHESTRPVTVTVADEDERRPPVITSNGGGATASVEVSENTTAVTTVKVDADAGSVLSYAIVGGADWSKFGISAAGVVSFLQAPDFESPGDADGNNTYEVTVEVTDGFGGTDIQTITVGVADVAGNVIVGSDKADRINGTNAVPGQVNTTSENDVIYGGAEDDRIAGRRGNDILKGEGGNDVLRGGRGDDDLNGGSGDDVLDGRFGNDVLRGGEGADCFQFAMALDGSGNVDKIVDFAVGRDRIQFDHAIFDGLGSIGTLAARAFAVGTAAHDADDRIIYDPSTGALFYDADGDSGQAAVQFAVVDRNLPLSNEDFLVY